MSGIAPALSISRKLLQARSKQSEISVVRDPTICLARVVIKAAAGR
jgi:hypothetical protein